MDEETPQAPAAPPPALQLSVGPDGRVKQHGYSLGDLEGHTIVALSPEEKDAFLGHLALLEPGGHLHHANGQITRFGPSAAYLAAVQTRQETLARRAEDLALLAASDDPVHQALARLLGGA